MTRRVRANDMCFGDGPQWHGDKRHEHRGMRVDNPTGHEIDVIALSWGLLLDLYF